VEEGGKPVGALPRWRDNSPFPDLSSSLFRCTGHFEQLGSREGSVGSGVWKERTGIRGTPRSPFFPSFLPLMNLFYVLPYRPFPRSSPPLPLWTTSLPSPVLPFFIAPDHPSIHLPPHHRARFQPPQRPRPPRPDRLRRVRVCELLTGTGCVSPSPLLFAAWLPFLPFSEPQVPPSSPTAPTSDLLPLIRYQNVCWLSMLGLALRMWCRFCEGLFTRRE
jgi:hypothetical protein